MEPAAIRAARRRDDFLAAFAAKGWYHSFELPGGERIDGFISLETLRERYARYPIPAGLRGRRVLDIGAWDGWFSFEAERRGAEVTAVDCVDLATFREIHRRLGSKVDYRTLDLFDLPAAGLGRFDYVFFLGVLYHLKHPLLGLEIVCAATRETALVDSFVTDGDTWREHADQLPSLEFYETDELGGRLDNWFGPSVSALLALCRAAGFARVELLDARGNLASVACHRRWEPVPAGDLAPAPRLEGAVNHADFGINFTTRRDQYLTCWFTAGREELSREDLRFEVGGFGSPALYLRREPGERWVANFRLPPGLDAGWHPVRLRLAGTGYSQELRIAVDLPPATSGIEFGAVCDGRTWEPAVASSGPERRLSLWLAGLPENVDRNNLVVRLGGIRAAIDYISSEDRDGFRQVNVVVPAELTPGAYRLTAQVGAVGAEFGQPLMIRP